MKPHPPAPKPPAERPKTDGSWWVGLDRAAFYEQCRLHAGRMETSKFGQSIFVSATAQKEQR